MPRTNHKNTRAPARNKKKSGSSFPRRVFLAGAAAAAAGAGALWLRHQGRPAAVEPGAPGPSAGEYRAVWISYLELQGMDYTSAEAFRAGAASMEMAYSKAWTIVKNAERQMGFPLLLSTTGGRHGGGAVLTEEGQALLDAYDGYCAELRETADRLYDKYFAKFQ